MFADPLVASAELGAAVDLHLLGFDVFVDASQ